MEVNTIKEIYNGHYQVILDFPLKKDILKILDLSYKYVWGVNHVENGLEWESYTHTLFGSNLTNIKVRNLSLEFLMLSGEFATIVGSINQSISIIQTNHTPPYYLNLNKLEGKAKYDLLQNKIDYLFELQIPGASDYSPIVSPDRNFLLKVLQRFNIAE